MSAEPAWAGRDVKCPHCGSVVNVPPPRDDGLPVRSGGPSLTVKRYFNFACARCGCLLEAHTGMSGSHGCCPTCAARFIVPHVDAGGMPMRTELLESDAPAAPTPLHAYAASGAEAPTFERLASGEMVIVCPRCGAHCALDAPACAACGAPFTMDAAPTTQKLGGEADALGAIICGVLALPLFQFFLPALAALAFGIRSLLRGGGRRTLAAVAVTLGGISLLGGLAFWAFR
ncbi:MAG: hypothetical protein U1D55_19805 [Phycisphaerae bacterium]